MKIGFEAKRIFRNFTGLGNYSRAVVKNLSENFAEHQYILYTPKVNPINSSLNLKAKNIQIKTPSSKLFSAIWRIWGVSKTLVKDRIDIFHGLSGEIPLNIHQYNIPSVVTIHDLIYLRYPHYFKPIDRAIYHYKFKQACINADRIIAISEQTKRDIIQFFGIDNNKVDVVYQGCDKVFHSNYPQKQLKEVQDKYQLPECFILCVGTIEPRKNQLLILKALKIVKADVALILVGKPTNYKEELLSYIDQNNLQHKVRFLENIPFTDLPLIYNLARIFVYPSRFEGFGIPVLEAISCGIPTIGATGSCLEEAGGPNCIYVSPDDEQHLAKSIDTIMFSEEIRNTMISKSFEYASQFSEEQIANNLMEVYKRTLENVKRRNQ